MESVAHLVKLWFRELPESVFQPILESIVDGMGCDAAQSVALCHSLPEENQKIIDWLLQLILDVCRHEADNRMTAQAPFLPCSRRPRHRTSKRSPRCWEGQAPAPSQPRHPSPPRCPSTDPLFPGLARA